MSTQCDNCIFVIWQTETARHSYTYVYVIHVFAHALIKLRVGDGYLFIFSTYAIVAPRMVVTE